MINTVVIQGNVCADVEVKYTQADIAYTRFNIAINERTKDAEKTYFIPVTAWRHTAEFIAKYFHKGTQIGVEGKLTQHTYTDNNGVKHNVIEVLANQVHFCGTKNSNGAGAQQSATTAPTAAPAATTATNNSGAGALGDLTDFEEILSDGEVPF